MSSSGHAQPALWFAAFVVVVGGIFLGFVLGTAEIKRPGALSWVSLGLGFVLFVLGILIDHDDDVSRFFLGAHTVSWYDGQLSVRTRVLHACADSAVRRRHRIDCARAEQSQQEELAASQDRDKDAHAARAWAAANDAPP